MVQPPAQMFLPSWNEIGVGLANHLWQSTIFMAFIGVLTLLFQRNSAFVRYRLWLIASIKFFIPLSLLVSVGTLIGESIEWPVARKIEQSQVSLVIQSVGQPFVTSLTMPPFSTPAPLSAGGNSIAAILALVWLIGAASVLIIWCVKWAQTARMVLDSKPFDAPDAAADIRIRTSAARMEPGVFGIFRPVLVLPADAAQKLNESQMQSLVAHEMVHVRGRDNLAAALHTVVEAVFWFHPLVWWLGSRLVDERERACDEAVLQLGFDRVAYAEGILQVCKSYLKAPACVSGVSGSNLKKRIEAIMENRETFSLTPGKKLLLTIAGAGVLIGPVFAGMMSAAESPIAAIPEIRLPVIESATSAALPVLSQTPAVQAGPQTSSVRVTVLPVIENATITMLPVISQAAVPSPQQNPAPTAVPAVTGQDKWLDDVSIVITDEERRAFQRLRREEERQNFIVNFWLVRDPTPGTATNEFRDEYNRRVAYANEHFTTRSSIQGSQTDRGKMYMLNGPPDEVVAHPTGGTYYRPADQGGGVTSTLPFETWRYRHIAGKGDNIIYEFVDRQLNGDYRLEYDPGAKDAADALGPLKR